MKMMRSKINYLMFPETDLKRFFTRSSCREFHCLDACEAQKILIGDPRGKASDELDDLQLDENSHEAGNIEAACSMANRYDSN